MTYDKQGKVGMYDSRAKKDNPGLLMWFWTYGNGQVWTYDVAYGFKTYGFRVVTPAC